MTRRLLPLFVLALLLVSGIASPVFAATKPTDKKEPTVKADISQAITTSYSADESIQHGIIVRLKDKAAGIVEPLKQADGDKMLGVVVAPDAAAVTLTTAAVGKQQVFVATSGRYEVLVSNQNGVINSGDYITISAVTGIGMKADENQGQIVGKAVSSFNGTKNVVSKVQLKDNLGKTNTAAIARIAVDITIIHNPLQQKATDFLPSFMANAATTIASKPISAARIYLGLAILVVSGFVTANIVYSGVRSGMISIGRNPLSKKSIVKSLIQTIIGGLIVFLAGIFAVYLILKL